MLVTTRRVKTPGEIPNIDPIAAFNVHNQDYTLGATETILFVDSGSIDVDRNDHLSGSFYNYGAIWSVNTDFAAIVMRAQDSAGNFGKISAISTPESDSDAIALRFTVWGPAFENGGDIFAIASDRADAPSAIAVTSFSSRLFTNSGEIHAESGDNARGYVAFNGANFLNSGTVHVASGRDARAIYSLGNATVDNRGLILAESFETEAEALNNNRDFSVAIEAGNELNLVNSGRIEGDIAILALRSGFVGRHDGAPEIINSGLIKGDVLFGQFANSIENSGRIAGIIDLGGGNDRFYGQDGEVLGQIYAGWGHDFVSSGRFSTTIYAEHGSNQIVAGEGKDAVYGGRGDDLIDGGAGDDALHGGFGDDRIISLGGDWIQGFDGDDAIELSDLAFHTINGGRGNDTVVLTKGLALDARGYAGTARLLDIEALRLEGGSEITLDLASIAEVFGDEATVSGSGALYLSDDGWEKIGEAGLGDDRLDIYANQDTTLTVARDIVVTLGEAGNGTGPSDLNSIVLPSFDIGYYDLVRDVGSGFSVEGRFTLHENETFIASFGDRGEGNVIGLSLQQFYDIGEFPEAQIEGDIIVDGRDGVKGVNNFAGGIVASTPFNVDVLGSVTVFSNYHALGVDVGVRDQSTLLNSGHIRVEGGLDVDAGGFPAKTTGVDLFQVHFENTGVIQSFGRENPNPSYLSDRIYNTVGVRADGGVSINHGEITAHSVEKAAGFVMALTNFNGPELQNFGTISATSEKGLGSAGVVVYNTGALEDILDFETLPFTAYEEIARIHNAGVISGDDYAIRMANHGRVYIENDGVLNGDVVFGDANDRFESGAAGRLHGSLDMGAGNDFATLGNGTDTILGEGGNDTLLGDVAVGLSGSEGQLYRAYQAVFGRDPDAAGFNAFMTEVRLGNADQVSIITEFVASAEFQATYGDLTNAEFVELLYTNVLPGNTDQQGRAAFTAALDNGSLTRVDMVVEFANAPEFILNMVQGSAAFATNVIIDPSEAAVFRIYQAVFQRDPDAGGFDAFTGSLQNQILTVEQITAEFVASAEFQATYGDLSNTEFVELLYTNVLPGNTDQQGRANFTAALDNGSLTRAAMVAEFSQSFEFIQAQSDAASAFVRAGYAEAGDTLDGGTGNDILFGGKGADIFVLSAGDDVVLDFTAGTDVLDLDAVSESASTILSGAEQIGADVRLTYEVSGQASSVTLRNVDLSDLSTGDFGAGGSAKTSGAPANTLQANSPIESYAVAADHGANYDSADYADFTDVDVWA